MVEELKPNSNRFKEQQKTKEPEKRAEKVVTGKVTARKKSGFSKIAGEIISEDARNVKSYVLGEVLIPAIKKAISDIVTNGIDIILYGGSSGHNKRSITDRVSYRSYSDDRRPLNSSSRYGSTSRYFTDDIEIPTRGEAEEVLERMFEILETYTVVRVADYYELVGIEGNWTDNKYGWTSLRGADIVRVRNGYMIKLPRATAID